MEPTLARKMWRTLEPFHGFIYFSKDAVAEYAALGLEGRAGYFASRAAPMGAVTAPTVTATFFNFDPGLVEASMAGAWDAASPAEVHAARLRAVDTGLRRMLGDEVLGSDELVEALDLARVATEGCRPEGRPLHAALAAMPEPDATHLQLWLAISVVREYRGDGHLAALLGEGVDALTALHLHAASGEVPGDLLKLTRGWGDEQWDEAGAAMVDRGLLDADGGFTAEGAALRQRVEDATDRMALAPWRHLGQEGSDRLRELVRPWSKAILASGGFALR